MNIEQDEQDHFDRKATELYLNYLKCIVDYIDEIQPKKMIEAFREHLEKLNSKQNPRFETYTINELLKVAFLFRINPNDFVI